MREGRGRIARDVVSERGTRAHLQTDDGGRELREHVHDARLSVDGDLGVRRLHRHGPVGALHPLVARGEDVERRHRQLGGGRP